jgi:hypothetical protein
LIQKKTHPELVRLLACAIVFFLLPLSVDTLSQTRVDSLEYLGSVIQANYINTRFEKQLNTFYLNSNFRLSSVSENILFKINENFGSTFIRNQFGNTRDEQHLNLYSKYIFSKDISVGFAGNSSLLSDNRSLGGINESAVNYAALFSEIRPLDKLTISPFGGYSNNRQIGKSDYGTLYGLEVSLDKLDLAELDINSELRLRNEDILPRRNLIRFFALSVSNNFDRGINNNIRTNFSENRKDFYTDVDSLISSTFNVSNNIQSRTETNYQIFDRLTYDGFLEYFTLDLLGGINWKSIDRNTKYKSASNLLKTNPDTKIDELKLEFDAATSYSSKIFDGNLRLNYYERDEKHQVKRFDQMSENVFEEKSESEKQKNNNSSRATLSLNGNLKFSKTDNLTLSLYQSKLIYDTQSELNDDDRDELLSILRLRYVKSLSPYFSAFINAEGTYGHTVYLFASRSSNNNVNRIYRLRTGGDYNGSVVQSYNSFEVSANYTVYDFEDVAINYKSYAFRQLSAVDSTTFVLNKNVSFFTYGYVKLSEVGDFDWTDFSSRPTRFLEEIYIEPRLVLNIHQSIFSVGLRLFSLNTYSYKKNIKTLETEYLSFGPIALIDVLGWNNLNIILKGYFEFISITNSADKQQANLTMQANWKF